jgi:hypothetical protein
MFNPWIRVLFVLSGIYDGVLGIAFLLFGPAIYRFAGVTPPNHFGYIQFPALLLITFAIMFLRIAGDPVGRRELMLYGMALKVSYCVVAFWHQFHGGIPMMFVPWAWADLVFLMLFFVAWKQTAAK